MAHRFRNLKIVTMLGWLLALWGCGGAAPESRPLDPDATVVRETAIVGFDTDAEPVLREMSDGSVWIQFEAMPPYFAEDTNLAFDADEFLAGLETAARATVVQKDRDVFVVANPTNQSVDSIKTFLESYPHQDGE